MAYMIVADQCTGCCACEPECPNKAISAFKSIFMIDPEKCTECIGHHDEPQCVAVCPIDDTCVIDETWPRQEAA